MRVFRVLCLSLLLGCQTPCTPTPTIRQVTTLELEGIRAKFPAQWVEVPGYAPGFRARVSRMQPVAVDSVAFGLDPAGPPLVAIAAIEHSEGISHMPIRAAMQRFIAISRARTEGVDVVRSSCTERACTYELAVPNDRTRTSERSTSVGSRTITGSSESAPVSSEAARSWSASSPTRPRLL